MQKASLIILAFAALFSAALTATAQSIVSTSPVKMPETLLSLYRHSDAVFEARFDKTEEGEVVKEDEDYSIVRIRKYFDVSSTLKGESTNDFMFTEDEYRYRRSQPEAYLLASAARNTNSQSVENTYGLKQGDAVLLFLKRSVDGKTLELTDDEEGLKKLSAAGLDAYERRIRELDSILSTDKVSPESIVKWLIRCSEEPETRWEGTFELIKGFERLDWQKKQKGEVIGIGENTDAFDAASLAKIMTDDQKKVLANILFDRSVREANTTGRGKGSVVRGDRELIDLVKRWGDKRLAGYLLDELRTKELTDYRNSETMRLIADLLHDNKIIVLADKYNCSYRQEASSADRNEVGSVNVNEMRAAIMTKFIQRATAIAAAQPIFDN